MQKLPEVFNKTFFSVKEESIKLGGGLDEGGDQGWGAKFWFCLVTKNGHILPQAHEQTRLMSQRVRVTSKTLNLSAHDSVSITSCPGMCLTMLQGSTAHFANANCWPLCSFQLPLLESTPPLGWSGPRTRGRATCCWTYAHSTVRLAVVALCRKTV